MALFWLINTVVIGGVKRLPGHSVDDTVEATADYTAAGALLWPQGNATIDAAAAHAASDHANKGINEADMQALMVAAVDLVQKTNDAAVTSDLASTSSGKGASLVGIQDAAGILAATTVEAALAEIAAILSPGGVTKIQLVTGTLAGGTATVTVGAGQVVTAATRAFPVPMAVITGSTNFGSLAHIFASNVAGGSGVGQVVVKALGNDGAQDVDAAGTFAAILIN